MPVTVIARCRARGASETTERTESAPTLREAWKALHAHGDQVLGARIEYQKANKKARRRKSPRSQAPEGSAGDE